MKKRYFVYSDNGVGDKKNPKYIDLYEILPSQKLGHVGWEEYNTGSFRGRDSVALAILLNEGIVSEKQYKNARGYYAECKANIDIRGI